jgi:hypothetical protein
LAAGVHINECFGFSPLLYLLGRVVLSIENEEAFSFLIFLIVGRGGALMDSSFQYLKTSKVKI